MGMWVEAHHSREQQCDQPQPDHAIEVVEGHSRARGGHKVAEADGGQRHHAKVEGVQEAPIFYEHTQTVTACDRVCARCIVGVRTERDVDL
eukprot:COSAG05_NODE_1062_length_5993_cov_8.045640_3_plen_91_part_00